MRIIAGEDYRLFRAQHLEQLQQVLVVVRLFDRLGAEVAVVQDVFARSRFATDAGYL